MLPLWVLSAVNWMQNLILIMEEYFGIILLISLIVKIGIHVFLDLSNNSFQGLGAPGMINPKLLFPYTKTVKPHLHLARKICNISYYIFLVTFIIASIYLISYQLFIY